MNIYEYGFHIPSTKYEILDYLLKVYPNDKWRLKAMKKKQLLAIYINVRKNQIDKIRG